MFRLKLANLITTFLGPLLLSAFPLVAKCFHSALIEYLTDSLKLDNIVHNRGGSIRLDQIKLGFLLLLLSSLQLCLGFFALFAGEDKFFER